jgi:hypothetical protein
MNTKRKDNVTINIVTAPRTPATTPTPLTTSNSLRLLEAHFFSMKRVAAVTPAPITPVITPITIASWIK